MILTLLVLPILAVSANPFHKYPYVFLLDVGNEELEKVNTEQIRLSSPGGSVALRYPAIGNGDDIAHIRVSGIDFGTDLKANIVDGGPGYKYVVIVLMGNPGVAYDAVLTVQTVPNIVTDDSIQNIEENSSGKNEYDPYRVSEEDKNDSSENFNDSAESGEINKVQKNENNGELTQESSNVYNYAQNEALSGYGIENNSDEGTENGDNDGDSDENYNEQADDFQSYNEQPNGENLEIENHDLNEDDSSPNQPSAEKYASDDGYSQSDSQPIVLDQNLYDKYVALKDHILYNGVKVYPQESIQENSNSGADQNYDYRPVDIENVYEDYEESDSAEYRDSNNNYLDTDGVSSVAY